MRVSLSFSSWGKLLISYIQLCLPGVPTLTASRKLVAGSLQGEKAMVNVA